MGEMADYYREVELDEHLSGPPLGDIPIQNYKWWRQGDGTRIKLTDMTKQHLQNSINMIERKYNWRQGWIEPLYKELNKRN